MLLGTPGPHCSTGVWKSKAATSRCLRSLIDVRTCDNLPSRRRSKPELGRSSARLERGGFREPSCRRMRTTDAGAALAARYAPAFPTGYRLAYGPTRKPARDIDRLRTLAVAESDDSPAAARRGFAPPGSTAWTATAPTACGSRSTACAGGSPVRCRAGLEHFGFSRCRRGADLPQ